MTKKELATKLYEAFQSFNLKQSQMQSIIECIFSDIYKTVEKGERVTIGGFVFKKHTRAARKGRNPKTGEAIDIPESSSIVCKVKLQ